MKIIHKQSKTERPFMDWIDFEKTRERITLPVNILSPEFRENIDSLYPPQHMNFGVFYRWTPTLPIVQGPGVFASSWAYEDKQYGYFWLNVSETGKGIAGMLFSNGKKWDGDTFNANVSLCNSEKKAIHNFSWTAGMNSAGISGGAKERATQFEIDKSPEWWASIHYMRVNYMMIDTVDDGAIWKGIIQLVTSADDEAHDHQNPPKG